MLPAKHPHVEEPFEGHYRRSLEFALRHRWLSLLAGFLLFIGSLGLAALLPTGFTPSNDNGIVSLAIQGAPGATFEDMQRSTEELTRALKQQADVDLVSANVGSNSSSGDLRSGIITVVLKNPRSMTTQQFQSHIRPILLRIPDARLGFTGQSASGGSSVQILLSGENGDQLDRTALQLEREMRGLSFLLNVHQVTPRPSSELVIRLKPDEAARLGVTADSVAAIARVATMGDVDANVAKFNAGTQRLPIRVRLSDVAREDMSVLNEMRVPTADGSFVPLSAVAEVSFQQGAAQIDRFDRARRATVEGELNGVSLGQAMKVIDKLPVLAKLPDGVKRAQYGESESMAELFGSFIGAMLAGIGMIYGVLVLLFRSFFKPVTILAALPLSLAGAFLALLIANSQLNLPVLIGLLMLMGLAAKNSILLVEHAIESERDGMSQHDALIEACRERARPIVMTTVAMAAGMLPTALGLGEGSEFRQPMAVAVIGGLISSTLLSLVLVPVVYEVVDDIEMWLRPRLARLVTTEEQARAQQAAQN